MALRRPHSTACLCLMIFLNALHGAAQEPSDLDRVISEIRKLEDELQAREDQERTLLQRLEGLDRKIGLQRKLLKELEEQRSQREIGVTQARRRLQDATRSHASLEERVGRRIVAMYKRGRFADWEILFSIRSIHQAAVWMEYKKRVIQSDRRNLRLLLQKREEIEETSNVLQRELNQKNALIERHVTETQTLEDQKSAQKTLLVRVRDDRESIVEQLREKRQAYREIEGRISQEEERRLDRIERIGDTRFADRKGSLDWPVRGDVIGKYGRQRHPVLKTWSENLGIDIRTEAGNSVRSVHRGVVRWVTWQRGMGNLLLVDHGTGHYTVYGHLDVVLVDTGMSVERGAVLGYVGDEESLYGSTLHFEVWSGTSHTDPEAWLN